MNKSTCVNNRNARGSVFVRPNVCNIKGKQYCESVNNVCHANSFAVLQNIDSTVIEIDICDSHIVEECSDTVS